MDNKKEIISEGVEGEIDGALYTGHQIEVDSGVRLANEAVGKPIILRRFHFQLPPDTKEFPTEKEIADEQQKRIELFLWKDEFVLIDRLRVKIDRERKTYDIFAPCQVKRGATLLDEAETLQDIAEKK